MTGRSRLAVTCVAVAAVLLFGQSMPQGQQPQLQVQAVVRAAVAQGHEASVIVGVHVDGYRAEGTLAAAEAVEQRTTIQAVSQRVLSRMPAAARGRARAFDFIPFFKTTIDLNTLLQLEADPEVVSISSSVPLIGINNPQPGLITGANFAVSGWALDLGATDGSTGVDQVHVYVYPSGGGPPLGLGVAQYGLSRPDVAGAYGAQFANSGFWLNTQNVPNGSYQLTIYGHSTVSGAFDAIQSMPITVATPPPAAVILLGAPLNNSTSGSTVTVHGFAIDLGAPAGTTGVDMVHVYAYPTGGGSPVPMGAATYGLLRPDVAAIFGPQFNNSGFQLQAPVPPGNYTIVAFMRSTVTGTFRSSASAVNVTVNSTNSNPFMLMDVPDYFEHYQPLDLSGWAVDSGAPSGTGIRPNLESRPTSVPETVVRVLLREIRVVVRVAADDLAPPLTHQALLTCVGQPAARAVLLQMTQ